MFGVVHCVWNCEWKKACCFEKRVKHYFSNFTDLFKKDLNTVEILSCVLVVLILTVYELQCASNIRKLNMSTHDHLEPVVKIQTTCEPLKALLGLHVFKV